MKKLKTFLKKVTLIQFFEDFIKIMNNPEIGFDANTERLSASCKALIKRMDYNESEFAAKVWSFYRYCTLRGNWASKEMSMKNLRLTKKLLKELGRFGYLFHQTYPGNEYHWSRKEFNPELYVDAIINFVKEHELEFSPDFNHRALEEMRKIEEGFESMNLDRKFSDEEWEKLTQEIERENKLREREIQWSGLIREMFTPEFEINFERFFGSNQVQTLK